MSLYNHVANKDDLLDGILDLVLAEMEPPDPAGGLPAIRAAALSAHEALRRHAWAANMLMSPGRIRPARIQYIEALLAALRSAGLSAETTYHAYHVLDAHIIGFSLWASTHGNDAGPHRGRARLVRRDHPGRDTPRTSTSTGCSISTRARTTT